jgi:TRAP transporter TAXI family solute receptor
MSASPAAPARPGAARHPWLNRRTFLIVVIFAPNLWLIGYLAFVSFQRPRLVISSGGAGGLYFKLGNELAEVLNEGLGDHFSFENRASLGSSTNIDLVQQNQVQLALAQDGLDAKGGVRALARLYDSPFQVVVPRAAGYTDLGQIPKRTPIFLGADGSGTRALSEKVLAHYGLALADFEVRGDKWTFDEAARALTDGTVKAAVFLVGFGAPALESIARTGRFTLVPIKRVDGLIAELPYLSKVVVPVAAYRAASEFPAQDTVTVATHELLIASAVMPERQAYKIVETLFGSSAKVVSHFPLLTQLSRIEPERNFYYPLHEGASAFYRRAGAPSIVTPEHFAASLSGSVSVLTGALFIVKRRRVRRTLKDLSAIRSNLLIGNSHAGLEAFASSLEGVRREAAEAYVAGKIAEDGFKVIIASIELCRNDAQRRRLVTLASAAASASTDRQAEVST